MDGVVIHNCYDHLLMFHVEPTPPGRQQGEVTSRQQGVTLRAHPAGIEELLGELLLNCLEPDFPKKWLIADGYPAW